MSERHTSPLSPPKHCVSIALRVVMKHERSSFQMIEPSAVPFRTKRDRRPRNEFSCSILPLVCSISCASSLADSGYSASTTFC